MIARGRDGELHLLRSLHGLAKDHHEHAPRHPSPASLKYRPTCTETRSMNSVDTQKRKYGNTLLSAALAIITAASTAPAADLITGPARVIDGDTIVVADVHVRLFGIDAPETHQTCVADDGHEYFCGRVAASALAMKISGRPVTCQPRTTDRYGRTVAVCFDAGNADLGVWLVRAGLAIAFRKYSTAYVEDEVAARRARRGLWGGEFVEPSDWRAAHGHAK